MYHSSTYNSNIAQHEMQKTILIRNVVIDFDWLNFALNSRAM